MSSKSAVLLQTSECLDGQEVSEVHGLEVQRRLFYLNINCTFPGKQSVQLLASPSCLSPQNDTAFLRDAFRSQWGKIDTTTPTN
jgi:hypothetical protein